MSATATTGTRRPGPTYFSDCKPCKRCGIERKSDKRGQGFCIDCRRFALTDGWVTK